MCSNLVPPFCTPHMLRMIAALLLAAGLAAATAPAAKRTPTIAPGVSVLGLRVGGLGSEPARDHVERAFSRPVTVAYGSRKLEVSPRRLGAGASIDAAVSAALAATPGSSIALPTRVSLPAIASYVAWLAHRYDRPARDAHLVGASDAGPSIAEGTPGTAVKRETMRRALAQLLRSGSRAPLQLLTKPVAPKVTRATYGAVIVIVRGSNSLRLFNGTSLVRAFGVATGRAQYPTPTGTFEIVDKQQNPWWRPPNSDWAKGAQPIPPGPGNPLGTRWMGLTAPGVGIHGTPDDASIGYSASHGCIRMHVPDAEWLFDHVGYGTPVVIL